MIFNYWPESFRKLYGGGWPLDYCCVDVETTGYSPNQDVIVEWGHILVHDGKIVDRLTLVFDWTDHPMIRDHWLRQRLDYVDRSMRASGAHCHMTYERMRKEGMKADKALRFVLDFTKAVQESGTIFAAHGGIFDEKMICANMALFKVAPGFSFGDNGLMDTEAVEKASQAIDKERVHPRHNDTLRSYFHRVKYSRLEGVKSNLDGHCYKKYGFEERGIKKSDLHAAETDAYCVHLLMEEFRGKYKSKPLGKPETAQAEVRSRPATRTTYFPQPASQRRVRGQRNS